MQFKNLSNGDLAILATIFAISLSQEFDQDDLTVLGDFLTIVGDVLALLGEERETKTGDT